MAPLISAITTGQTQAEDRANNDRKERQAKETKTVATMLGKEHLARLLLLCGVSDEADLSDLWPKLASAPKASRLGVLQGMIQEEYLTQGLQYEHHLPNLSFFLNLTSMIWVPFGDMLEGGLLANPFLFGDTNQAEFHSLNCQLQLVTENGAVPTLADAQALLKSKLTLPGPEESIRILHRWKVCLSVVLPRGHPLVMYISEHMEEMKSFEQPWNNYLTHEPPKYRLKGVLHLKFLMIKVCKFIHAINRGRQLPVLDPNKISEAVLDGKRWEPIITPAFEAQYRLNHFAQHQPASGAPPPAPTTPGVGRGPPPPPPPPLGGGGGGGGVPVNNGDRMENTGFNASLFGSYKVSHVKTKTLQDKISQGTLAALPMSKVDILKAMCLAWHTKGQCNSNCPCAYDHVQYSAPELAPLLRGVLWVMLFPVPLQHPPEIPA